MEQEIHITVRFNLATGKVGPNPPGGVGAELTSPTVVELIHGFGREGI